MTPSDVHLIVPGPLEQRTGGSIYDRRMADGLRRLGWNVMVHELRDDGSDGVGRASDDAFARDLLDEALAGLPDGALALVDGLASRGSPDLLRAARGRLRLLVLVHLLAADDPGLDPTDRAALGSLERQGLAASSGVIASSEFMARRLAELGIEVDRIRAAPPGTDQAPEASGPPSGAAPQLLCVAAVTPGKGQDLLVRALDRLAELPWTCVCAGSLDRDVAYADSVLVQVRDAGLADRVVFPGELDREALADLYLTSSVFVLPSSFETYGLALAEAMARGLPVVATRVGAIPETVPAQAGLLVPAGDDAALAEALRSLIGESARGRAAAHFRRRALGAAGRAHAARLPDWEQAAVELERALLDLATLGH